MPGLDPISKIQLMSGAYYPARCLQVAAELGVADLIGDTRMSAESLAQITGSHPQALARVLSLLCAHDIFDRVDGAFGHTEMSRLLRTDHPASMRSFARMFGTPLFWEAAIRLDKAVATGRPTAEDVTPGGVWRYFEAHPEANEVFNSAMATKARAVVPLIVKGYRFSDFARVADVGGGRGHLLQGILESAPGVTGVLFDQPHVVQEAAAIASERLHLQGGSFFSDDLPQADAYVLMEVIHDWDDEASQKILQAVRRAAPSGAKVLLIEAMMPDRPTQCWTATMDLVMMNLLGGRQRSFVEYESLLKRSGFDDVREIPIGMGNSIIEASAI